MRWRRQHSAGEPVIPDVYIFTTSNAQPSTPEALEEIQEEVVKRIGIRPHSIFSPGQQADEKLALLLSSGERLDIFKGAWPDFSSRNVIRPIAELLDSRGGNIREWLRPSLWPTVTDPQGVIWGIPDNASRLNNPVWIRADWLERYDKPVPATITELGELLQFFKQEDPAGNGNTIVLLMDQGGMNMTFAAGFLEAGWPNWYDRTTGSIRHSVEDPGYRDYLTLMRGWFEAGYINPDFFNIKMTDLRAHIANGLVPVVGAWYSSVTHTASAQLADMDPNARYLMVPELRGPKGLAESAYPQNTGGAVMITATFQPRAGSRNGFPELRLFGLRCLRAPALRYRGQGLRVGYPRAGLRHHQHHRPAGSRNGDFLNYAYHPDSSSCRLPRRPASPISDRGAAPAPRSLLRCSFDAYALLRYGIEDKDFPSGGKREPDYRQRGRCTALIKHHRPARYRPLPAPGGSAHHRRPVHIKLRSCAVSNGAVDDRPLVRQGTWRPRNPTHPTTRRWAHEFNSYVVRRCR